MPKKATAKQRKVLKALEAGKTPKEIAKSMKIGPTGVYAHIGRLKALNLLDADGKPFVQDQEQPQEPAAEELPPLPPPHPESVSIVGDDILKLLKQSLEVIDERILDIKGRFEQISKQTQDLQDEAGILSREADSLAAQREKIQEAL